jgi:hypothetical protein
VRRPLRRGGGSGGPVAQNGHLGGQAIDHLLLTKDHLTELVHKAFQMGVTGLQGDKAGFHFGLAYQTALVAGRTKWVYAGVPRLCEAYVHSGRKGQAPMMRRYLSLLSVPGLVLLLAQCSMVDKAKVMAGGSSNSSGSPASAVASVAGDPAAAATSASASASEGGKSLPAPDPTKNVLGVPYPAATGKPAVMDEMSQDYPFIWISTEYKNDVVVWSPKVRVVIRVADAKRDDVLVIQHLQGKKKLGTPQKCMPNGEPWKTDGASLIKFDCSPAEDVKLTDAGAFAAALTYIQASAGKKHEDFATLKYNVLKYRADAKPTKPDMKFVVDYDFHMGDAWIYPEIRSSNIHPDYTHDPMTPLYAIIHTWLKWEKQEPSEPVMRCYFGDKEIAQATGNSGGGGEYEFYKDAKSDSKKIGWSKYKFYFDKMVYQHALDPDARKNFGPMHVLADNPGDYTCKLTHQGDVIRVIKFSFKGNDVVRSACEKNLVTFSPTALIQVTEMKGDAPFAKDAYKKNGFFNRAEWPAGCPK